jgi:TRAP-type mannitol/chloroaromatic compound transport system substrate-binding protein
MRVRALAGIGDAMRKLGAVPTSVDATEVYTSLERGTVDAAAFPSTYAHQSYRTYEVTKWYTENLALGSVGCPTLIHVDRWAELPPQYKALFEEARPIAQAAAKKAYAEADEKNLPLFRKKLQFIKFTPDELAAFRKAGGHAGVGGMGDQARGPRASRPRAPRLPAQGSRFAEILSAPMPRDRG